MTHSYFDFQGNTWYCISIYYTGKDNYQLMPAISSFCSESMPGHYLLFLSDDSGDHINLAFSFPEPLDKGSAERKIAGYFSDILRRYPSRPPEETAFGNVFWMNYPNNCMVWNRFNLPEYILFNQYLLEFADSNSLLLTCLIDEEAEGPEDYLSLAVFLLISLSKSETFSGNEFYKTIADLFGENDPFDLRNVSVLDAYLNYSDETFDPIFKIWITKAGMVLSELGLSQGIISLLNIISQQLGLGYSNKLIVSPVIAWSKARKKLGQKMLSPANTKFQLRNSS